MTAENFADKHLGQSVSFFYMDGQLRHRVRFGVISGHYRNILVAIKAGGHTYYRRPRAIILLDDQRKQEVVVIDKTPLPLPG